MGAWEVDTVQIYPFWCDLWLNFCLLGKVGYEGFSEMWIMNLGVLKRYIEVFSVQCNSCWSDERLVCLVCEVLEGISSLRVLF